LEDFFYKIYLFLLNFSKETWVRIFTQL
jgi:hypothetical protein